MSLKVYCARRAVVVGLGAAALVAASAPDSAWAHAGHAQLRPTSVSSLTWADPANPLRVTLTVANHGSAAARNASAHAYLSADKKQSKHDQELSGSIGVPALHAGKHVTEDAALALPKKAKLGTFWLLACVSGHCVAAKDKVHVTATPKTSAGLIDAAHLSKGSKIVYRVYAALGDPRLPSRYRGDDPPLSGDLALSDARAQWSVLTKHERAQISPYLQPPSGPQGWSTSGASRDARTAAKCEHRGPRHMDYVDSPDNRIRIWYEDTSAYDRKIAPGLAKDAATIYQAFVKLMGRKLPSDADVCGMNGGDGHYDVYILDPDEFGKHWKGFAITDDYAKGGGPAYTYFSSAPDKIELAHELFHAFQFAFKRVGSVADYAGFDEGSATWAAEYLYPDNYLVGIYDEMLTYTDDANYTFPDNRFGYELWAFDRYLTETYGDQLMREIYLQFGHQPELPALNSVIPGGWARGLAEFTRYGWNQTPVEGGFRAWDNRAEVPSSGYQQPIEPMNLHLGELASRTLNLPDKLAPLTRAYYPLHVDDSHIHDLVFRNTVHGIQGAGVQAFVKLKNGTWLKQDWTGKKSVEFCRDNGPDQDVTDLVIMYDNARYQDTKPLAPDKQPTLELRNNCDRYYRVSSVSGTYTENFSIPDTTHSYSCTDPGTQTYSYSVDKSPAGRTDGSYTPNGIGDVFVPVKINGSDDYGPQTCTGGQPFLDPCTATLTTSTSFILGLGTIADSGASRTVQIPSPDHLGAPYVDGTCDSDWKYGGVTDGPDHQYLTSPSMSEKTLDGTAPFTVHGSDTYDVDGYSITRDLTITLQPTDEDGNPLQ